MNITCRVCANSKPVGQYGLTPTGNPRKICKSCEYERRKAANANNPNWKAQRRATIIRFKYGIEPAQYDLMLESQDGKCAVCKEISDEMLHVDHDHSCCPDSHKTCGKCVRGLLCRRCNLALGYLDDSTNKLQSAINYLSR